MGEARRRGTFEQRKAQSIKRNNALREKNRETALLAAKDRPQDKLRPQQINYLTQILAMAIDNRSLRVFR